MLLTYADATMIPPLDAPREPLLIAAVATGAPLVDVVHHTDLLTLCAALPAQSVDMILADLPYETTQNGWDKIIPTDAMWGEFRRLLKVNGVIVLTASQPFTTRLIASNYGMFRYEWIWVKAAASGFLDANRKPMKRHESVIIFSSGRARYFPQMDKGNAYRAHTGSVSANYGSFRQIPTISTGNRFPTSVLNFPNETGLHPTQKPVALFEYLIRTYTRPGEVVLDPVCGSGTTAIACRNTGRHWICGDKELKYVNVAKERLAVPFNLPLFAAAPAPVAAEQLTLPV